MASNYDTYDPWGPTDTGGEGMSPLEWEEYLRRKRQLELLRQYAAEPTPLGEVSPPEQTTVGETPEQRLERLRKPLPGLETSGWEGAGLESVVAPAEPMLGVLERAGERGTAKLLRGFVAEPIALAQRAGKAVGLLDEAPTPEEHQGWVDKVKQYAESTATGLEQAAEKSRRERKFTNEWTEAGENILEGLLAAPADVLPIMAAGKAKVGMGAYMALKAYAQGKSIPEALAEGGMGYLLGKGLHAGDELTGEYGPKVLKQLPETLKALVPPAAGAYLFGAPTAVEMAAAGKGLKEMALPVAEQAAVGAALSPGRGLRPFEEYTLPRYMVEAQRKVGVPDKVIEQQGKIPEDMKTTGPSPAEAEAAKYGEPTVTRPPGALGPPTETPTTPKPAEPQDVKPSGPSTAATPTTVTHYRKNGSAGPTYRLTSDGRISAFENGSDFGEGSPMPSGGALAGVSIEAFEPVHPSDVPAGVTVGTSGEFVLEVLKQGGETGSEKPTQIVVGVVDSNAPRQSRPSPQEHVAAVRATESRRLPIGQPGERVRPTPALVSHVAPEEALAAEAPRPVEAPKLAAPEAPYDYRAMGTDPNIRITPDNQGGYHITYLKDGKVVSSASIERSEDGRGFTTSGVRTVESEQNRGLGQKVYEAAAKLTNGPRRGLKSGNLAPNGQDFNLHLLEVAPHLVDARELINDVNAARQKDIDIGAGGRLTGRRPVPTLEGGGEKNVTPSPVRPPSVGERSGTAETGRGQYPLLPETGGPGVQAGRNVPGGVRPPELGRQTPAEGEAQLKPGDRVTYPNQITGKTEGGVVNPAGTLIILDGGGVRPIAAAVAAGARRVVPPVAPEASQATTPRPEGYTAPTVTEAPPEAPGVATAVAAPVPVVPETRPRTRKPGPAVGPMEDAATRWTGRFPEMGGKITKTGVGLQIQLKSGNKILVQENVPEITVGAEAETKYREIHPEIPETTRLRAHGKTMRIGPNALIQIAKNARDGTDVHEVTHVAYDMGVVTRAEDSVLGNKYAKEIADPVARQEAIADGVATEATPKFLKRFIARVLSLGEMLQNAAAKVGLAKEAVPSEQRVVTDVRTGRVLRRGAKTLEEMRGKYQIRPEVAKELTGEVKLPEEARAEKPTTDLTKFKLTPEEEKQAVAIEGVEPEGAAAAREKYRGRGAMAFTEPTTTAVRAGAEKTAEAVVSAETPRGGKPPEEFINFDRITNETDVQKALQAMADAHPEEMRAARGYRSQDKAAERSRYFTQSDLDRIVKEEGRVSDAVVFGAKQAAVSGGRAVAEAARNLEKARVDERGVDEAEKEYLKVYNKALGTYLTSVRAGAEAGRALAMGNRIAEGMSKEDAMFQFLLKKQADPRLVAELAKLDLSNPEVAMKAIRAASKPRVADMIQEYILSAMMSGPATHIRNFVSNSVMQLGKFPEKLAASWIDAAYSRGTGAERERYAGEVGKEAGALARELWQTLHFTGNAAKAAADVWQERGDVNWGKIEATHVPALPGKVGKFIRGPLRAAGASDAWFGTIAAQQEISARTYRLAKNDVKSGKAKDVQVRMQEILSNLDSHPDILRAAKKARDYWTFRDELGPKSKKVLGLLNDMGILRLAIAPFFKTPVKITGRFIERSPIGLMRTLAKMAKKQYGTRGEAEDDLARGLMGTMMAGAIYGFAQMGNVTGMGPSDTKKKTNKMATGWQPYSIKVGDTYYSYQGMEPLSSLLMAASNVYEVASAKDHDKWVADTFRAAKDVAIDKTSLQGFQRISLAIGDPERWAKQFAQGLVGMPIPAVVARTAAAIDQTARRRDTFWDVIRSRIPGMTGELEPRRTITGKEVVREQTPLETFVSPFQRTTEKPAPLERELDRLGYVPVYAPRKVVINKKDYELTQEQMQFYVEADKKAAAEALKAIKMKYYQAAPEEPTPDMKTKQEILRDIWAHQRALARMKVVREVYRRR